MRIKTAMRHAIGDITLALVLAGTLLAAPPSSAQELAEVAPSPQLPFPQNRIRDFYARQARHFLASDQPLPEILPEFPGLDGGIFGHWGQNPEADNYDETLGNVDVGGLIAQVVNHYGRRTTKAVTTRIGDEGRLTVMFDPSRLTFTEVWSGGFVKWQSRRYGITSGVDPAGPRLFDLSKSRWRIPANVPTRYLGYYRSGRRVVFSYKIGEAHILDHAWEQEGALVRSLFVKGRLPVGTTLAIMETGEQQVSIRRPAEMQFALFSQQMQDVAVGVSVPPTIAPLTESGHMLSLDVSRIAVEHPINIVIERMDAGNKLNEIGDIRRLAAAAYPSPESFTSGGPPQWAGKSVTTQGELGKGDGPYTIDTLTIPYRSENPFRTPMRVGGVDFLPDGRAAVSTLMGDVWLVDGIDDDLDRLRWTRIAAGLHQPLGLVVKDGKILALGGDQITRLHDLNGDGETDFYECLTNDYPTDGGNNFALTLHQDRHGSLYWFTRSSKFDMTRFNEGGRPESIATGLRGTNGTGVSDDGGIVLATAQEGSWTPATSIFEVGEGSYHGYYGPREEFGKYGYQLPLCFVPRGVDNSSGDIAFLPDDSRFGPLAGQIIGTSFGYCQHYLILREELGETVQGGVVPLPGEFLSGAHRSRYNRLDGHFYVAGTDGWQSYAQKDGSLQRVRYVGGEMPLATGVETRANGLIVRFNCQVDPQSVRVDNVFCQEWNYLYSKAYGSAEYSARHPGRRGHDPVTVRSVQLLDDGQSVFVEIPQLHPVMQFHLHMQLATDDGSRFSPDVFYSIYELGEPYTNFDGYRPISKRRYLDFPIAEAYPRDPRIEAQDALGKVLVDVVSVRIDAVAGLQYQPRVLRVPPGRRIALTVRNTDPSMPHNFVLVQAERLEDIGEAAMLLAADPRAIATHYAPHDPGVICLSPILNPHEQYTIYFNSPKEKGAYPFLCTYPGHWQVMRGVLYVADEGEAIATQREPGGPVRQFVRMWKTADLAADAADLTGHSLARGREMFHVTGCIKCHVIAGEGVKLGPELTDVRQRYRGAKLLEQILEPSTEVHKDYRTYTIVTTEGTVATGLIVHEDAESVRLLPNPLKPQEILTVAKGRIDEMETSEQSTMPKGLLMTLDRGEILDLLRFIESGGSGTDSHSGTTTGK